MFQLAPIGLPPKKSPEKFFHKDIEEAVTSAVEGIINSKVAEDFIYSLAHPQTVTLVKSFDLFFSHGYDLCLLIFRAYLLFKVGNIR
jgi:hypothetical protein